MRLPERINRPKRWSPYIKLDGSVHQQYSEYLIPRESVPDNIKHLQNEVCYRSMLHIYKDALLDVDDPANQVLS